MNEKAEFRLLREAVGMTQAAMARELGVEVRSVKRWESQEAPQAPPQDAWNLLEGALAEQDRAVSAALAAPASRIPYWTSDGEHAQWADDPSADWRMDNATLRRIWAALRDLGSEPEVVDGRGNPSLIG